MMTIDTARYLGEVDPIAIAALVGACLLFVLSIPYFLASGQGEGRIRRSMIERHQARLKNESMRRGRVSETLKAPRRFESVMTLVGLLPNEFITSAHKKLRSAGCSDNSAIFVFWTTKITLMIFSVIIFIILFFSSVDGFFGKTFVILSLTFFFCGLLLPDYVVALKRKFRQKNIELGLPDGLDLLVICAEAGLSLDASLKRVADEFVTVVPELSEELLLTSVELNFLPDRRQALTNLAQRADVPAFRAVTATLIQTEKYGTPLAQALRTLASEYRETRLLLAEEKAARLPAILTVPMILFILPALFIVLAAPAFIQVAEKFGN